MTESNEEKILSNVLEVVDYLRASGWKVSKSTIYNHVKEGKLRPGDDGKYRSSHVDRYALNQRTKRLDGGGSLDKLSEEKARIQNRKDLAQAEHWELKTKIAQGQYVRRDAFERELAYRAMIFKNDVEAFCRAQAGVIVELTDGDKDKVPDLVEYMLAAAAGWLNRYSADREFVVPEQYAEASLKDLDDDEAAEDEG